MKLLLIVFCAAIFLVSGAPRTQIDEDEWTFDKEGVAAADQPGRTDSPIFEYDYDFVLTESAAVMTEEPATEEPTTTTKKAKTTKATTTTTTTTTTTVKPESESTGEKTKTGRKPSINRTRAPSTSTSSRRVNSATTTTAAAADDDLEEVTETAPKRGGQKMKSTSPASLDTSSVAIKAPSKGFKPTSKPMSDEEPKDLSLFLKKRKEERIQATTTIDPFIAILATATPLPTAEPVTVAGGRGSSSSSSAGGSRLSGISSRRGSSGPRITARPTTESAPIEVPTEARRSGLSSSSNRFANSRKASPTTTTAQPTIDAPEFQVETTTKSKLTPKRPAVFRPVGNSISRKKDQTTTTTEAPADVIVPQEETVSVVEEMDLEPVVTTRRPLRRAQSQLLPSSRT